MSSKFFKVIFEGSRKFESKKLILVFKGIIDKTINIPSHFIDNLKKIIRENSDFVFFQNINEVIKLGNQSSSGTFTNYSVILYIKKSTGYKEGLLIGEDKSVGERVIGIWPFNIESSKFSVKNIAVKCEDLVKKTQNYSSICLIN